MNYEKIYKSLEAITNSKEEFEQLLDFDTVYLVYTVKPDDNDAIEDSSKLFRIHDDIVKIKLRGEYEGPAKLQCEQNHHNWVLGHAFMVPYRLRKLFEKHLIMLCVKKGYRVDCIRVMEARKEQQRESQAQRNAILNQFVEFV